MADFEYDLIVIGSGPAGQRAAIQAAKLNKRVAIVERKAVIGGDTGATGNRIEWRINAREDRTCSWICLPSRAWRSSP